LPTRSTERRSDLIHQQAIPMRQACYSSIRLPSILESAPRTLGETNKSKSCHE
jgi:hypothetical protein